MPRPANVTRDRILQAALRLFCEKGYDRTTVIDISAPLELTPAALYYHFDRKDAILSALIEPLIDATDDLIVQVAHIHDGAESRGVILGAYLDLLIRWQSVVQLVHADPAVRRQAPVAERLDDQQSQLQALLGGGDERDAVVATTAAAVGALWRPVMILSDEQLVSQRQIIVDAAVRALGTALPQ